MKTDQYRSKWIAIQRFIYQLYKLMKNRLFIFSLSSMLVLFNMATPLFAQSELDTNAIYDLQLLGKSYKPSLTVIEVDTITVAETRLEERHISYIYNFSFNNAMHNYESYRWNRLSRHSGSIVSDNDRVLVIMDVLPANLSDLEFFQPYHIGNFALLNNSHRIAHDNGILTQFELDYLPTFNKELEEYFPMIMKALEENSQADFAVSFSELYTVDSLIYVFVGVTFHGDFYGNLPGGAHIFEFEWCETMQVVYPRRVSASNFHVLNIDSSPPKKIGGTVEIPSLKCLSSKK